jgi:tetratricopeptide (TPR) repeat protein
MPNAAVVDVNSLFSRAEHAFRDGKLDEARQLLDQIEPVAGPHPAVLHLTALVEKGRGNIAASQVAFEEALRHAPQDPQIANNYGNLLLGIGEVEAAIEVFDRTLAIAPGFAEARFNRALALEQVGRLDDALGDLDRAASLAPATARLFVARGNVLRSLGRLAEAAMAYDQALQLEPKRTTALHGRARTAMDRGDAGASDLYADALAAAPDDLALHLGYAEALQAEGDPRALDVLAQLVAGHADWAEGQSALARMRWQAGESASFARGFTDALESQPADRELWNAYIAGLARAELWGDAAKAAEGAFANVGDPQLLLLAAGHWSEAGDLARAQTLFDSLPAGLPGRKRAELRHRIRQGHYDEALAVAEESLRENPWEVSAWAMLGLLWRVVDDPRAEWLHGQSGLVGARQIELDEPEIARIAQKLRSLHRTRAHPLGESLRGGTQTRGRLFDREEPEIRTLYAAIAGAVERHWAALPPLDPTHPLLRHRERQPRFAGSWSVRLTGGGFHVAHIHDGGILSSACYLLVPETEEPGEGWLEIGCPPAQLNLPIGPLTTVEPVPGRLVLFPSTLLHGTRPFAKGERLTAAFDIVAG